MKLFHFSDNHGKIEWLKDAIPADVDMIVSTGDFFPNCSSGILEKEVTFQRKWLKDREGYLQEVLNGRPFLVVNGNHDFICLAEEMFSYRYYNTYKISCDGETIKGLKFAGFDEVPYFTGQWYRETDWQEMKEIVEETFAAKPDILVTHAPCLGILDDGIGCEPLLTALSYEDHNIKHHLFGHNHVHGGQSVEKMGVTFHNNAKTGRVIEL
jgi:Icc-related predicted phosphoesterase